MVCYVFCTCIYISSALFWSRFIFALPSPFIPASPNYATKANIRHVAIFINKLWAADLHLHVCCHWHFFVYQIISKCMRSLLLLTTAIVKNKYSATLFFIYPIRLTFCTYKLLNQYCHVDHCDKSEWLGVIWHAKMEHKVKNNPSVCVFDFFFIFHFSVCFLQSTVWAVGNENPGNK